MIHEKNLRQKLSLHCPFKYITSVAQHTSKLDMSVTVSRKSHWPVENVEVPVERWGELAAFHCRQLCGLAFLLEDKTEWRRQSFQTSEPVWATYSMWLLLPQLLPERQRGAAPADLLQPRWIGTQRVHTAGFPSWLVHWRCLYSTIEEQLLITFFTVVPVRHKIYVTFFKGTVAKNDRFLLLPLITDERRIWHLKY